MGWLVCSHCAYMGWLVYLYCDMGWLVYFIMYDMNWLVGLYCVYGLVSMLVLCTCELVSIPCTVMWVGEYTCTVYTEGWLVYYYCV